MKVTELIAPAFPSEELPTLVEARLSQDGYASVTRRCYLRAIVRFLEWLPGQAPCEQTDVDTAISRFLEGHVRSCRCRPRCPNREMSRAALGHMKRAIADNSTASENSSFVPDLVEDTIQSFDKYMKDTCGLSATTRLQRRRIVRRFLSSRPGGGAVIRNLDLAREIEGYVTSIGRMLTAGSMAVVVAGLRSYLRYLQFRGEVDPRLLCSIAVPPRMPLRNYPRVLSCAQCAALMDSFDLRSPSGMRDHAMALCMLVMGLRATEVAAITLDDIDWRVSVLHIHSGKSRLDRDLPVMENCGNAIARYLKAGRPKTPTRRLFVRHAVPVGSEMNAENVRGAMRRAYARAGFPSTMTGTHILRHTAATNMLNSGSSLKEIADVLGHQSINTTIVYTKVNTEALRCVAQPWPGGRL